MVAASNPPCSASQLPHSPANSRDLCVKSCGQVRRPRCVRARYVVLLFALVQPHTNKRAPLGHQVTAPGRNETSLAGITSAPENLTIIKGQMQDMTDVEKAFVAVALDTPDAVIVMLNSARRNDNPFAKSTSPPTLMHDAHVDIGAAMKIHNIRKLVTLQTQGVGVLFSSLFLPIKLLARFSNMDIGYKDHEHAEGLVKQSGLLFVLARPARFVNATSAPMHYCSDTGEGIGSFATTTRESVAMFLLDVIEREEWDGTAPVLLK
jgi:hypothetical protein